MTTPDNSRKDEDLERTLEGFFKTRLRYGKGLRGRFLIKLKDEEAAKLRDARLRELAEMLSAAGHSAEAPIILRKAAAVTSDADFAEAARVAVELCSTSPKARAAIQKRAVTFRELGEQWTSGALHKRFPDQVKKKRTASDDVSRLTKHVYPLLGPKLIHAITLDDCEEVMRKLPADMSPLTRRNVGQAVVRMFNMAVYPLRLIERSPIPSGFLPKSRQPKALAYLYPDEDRRLMACATVPLPYRLLWGFLAREGMREGEALSLTFGDLDLERGAVRLDRNKTDDPRVWALSAGVTAVLKGWRTLRGAEPSDLVFVDEQGAPIIGFGLPTILRAHLEAIGLKNERPELFKSTDERIRIRVHDLRGTFVTVSLANGRTEAWISDRTGHRSSQMIGKYKRTARTFAELALSNLLELDQAIPEFKEPADSAPPVTDVAAPSDDLGGPEGGPEFEVRTGFEPAYNGFAKRPRATRTDGQASTSLISDTGTDTEKHGGPRISGGVGQELAQVDQVEEALGVALKLAAEARQWSAVETLSRELGERRRARTAPAVASLDAERARRGRKQ